MTAEEKIDEYLQSQIPGNHFVSTSRSSEEKHFCTLLRELAVFLTDSETERTNLDTNPDSERLLLDASSVYADSRPPADFVVYEDGSMTPRPANENSSPPIFDGSVANSTPPPLGHNVGATGGSGTVLHLACALDRPLALAFLLAMGADARSSHTAFRRHMIHEAACNGSINCLRLLLELGKQYGDIDKQLASRLSMTTQRISGRSSTFELPFLPRRMNRAHGVTPLQLFPTEKIQKEFESQNSKPETKFIDLLYLFRQKVFQVRNGAISEYEAARQILEHAKFADTTKASFARSCSFNPPPVLLPRTFIRSPHGDSSDGHGNTPLHWAAFKNKPECVKLLLSYNADPNARAHPSGWTPLHDASYSNSTDCIELLIDAGGRVDARANSGATPLCFAAQEDSAESAAILLKRGADMTARCSNGPSHESGSPSPAVGQHPHTRFSGYTPLHYCAHYNAHKAASLLLSHPKARVAMEITDLSDRLPIHVAAARGSAEVLRELLHHGARVETRPPPPTRVGSSRAAPDVDQPMAVSAPSTPRRPPTPEDATPRRVSRTPGTPVSSPMLRSMIPQQPVVSNKPWNCLSQRSIDECRVLIAEAEREWNPDRHSLFTPNDRRAVVELLIVGKRLEREGILFRELWPQVLSFCGRGWFETSSEDSEMTLHSEDDAMQDDESLALPMF